MYYMYYDMYFLNITHMEILLGRCMLIETFITPTNITKLT